MSHPARSRGSLLVGASLLLVLGLTAVPQRTVPLPARAVLVRELRPATDWLALGASAEAAGGWRSAGPLRLHERGDGTARLTGWVERGADRARLDLELSGGGSVAEPELGPGGYLEASGLLLTDDGPIRLAASGAPALEAVARHGRLDLAARDHAAGADEVRLTLDLDFLDRHAWSLTALELGLRGGAPDLVLRAGGRLVEDRDGSATLTALLEEHGGGEPAYRLELELTADAADRTVTPPGLEVHPLAASLDGSGDGALWRPYDHARGTLVGVGPRDGEAHEVTLDGGPLWVGRGIDGRDGVLGARGALRLGGEGPVADLGATLDAHGLEFVLAPAGSGALDLGPLGDDWTFGAGASLTHDADGESRLTGRLERSGDAASALLLDLRFPADEPASTGQARGTLEGRGVLAGWLLEVGSGSSALRFGQDAAGDRRGEATLELRVLAAGTGASPEELPGRATVAFGLRHECVESVAALGGEGLDLGRIGDDFQLVAGGRLVRRGDGNARLTGVVARPLFPTHGFLVDLTLTGWSPSTGAWSGVEGRLFGLDDFHGGRLEVAGGDAPWSAGTDGQGRTTLAGDLDLRVTAQPNGEWRFRHERESGRLALSASRDATHRASEAFGLLQVEVPSGHALHLPGVAADFVWEDGGRLVERADGTATLTGRLVSRSTPELRFDLRLDLEGRVLGAGDWPVQAGLPASAFAARGGPVDPARWTSYRRARGVLVGGGALSGAVLELGRDDGALQVGLGASGRNLRHGAGGDLAVRLLAQPVLGEWILPEYLPGAELHVDLEVPPVH